MDLRPFPEIAVFLRWLEKSLEVRLAKGLKEPQSRRFRVEPFVDPTFIEASYLGGGMESIHQCCRWDGFQSAKYFPWPSREGPLLGDSASMFGASTHVG